MKLHNTLSRKPEELQPLDNNQARIYSCGPTVYDHAHIGNLSAYIFADTLRRVAHLSTGKKPKHVMNYTDVDDKTIRRSREKYPNLEPKEALRKLTDEYIELFMKDMKRIGNDVDAITFTRATDHIDGMKDLITKLCAKGFAYLADDGVYFSIDAYRKSDKTYGQLLELNANNTSEARIANDEYDKESIHDFALWKKQKDDEPAWEFEIDGQNMTGRPGWHIECSVMSRAELGQPFDIHTGGVDLIFPHHENEIAQSTALEDNPMMAQIFAHNEHILVDGKKMSKSANNFYTLQDIVDKGFDPLAFRLLVLQAHYRSQVHFSWENLQAAQNRLRAFQAMADLRWQLVKNGANAEEFAFSTTHRDIEDGLFNDLNTAQALAALSAIEQFVTKHTPGDYQQDELEEFLAFIDEAFGLKLLESRDIDLEQKQLIADREAARDTKDWQKSDDIRVELVKQGLGLRDTPHGTVWYRL